MTEMIAYNLQTSGIRRSPAPGRRPARTQDPGDARGRRAGRSSGPPITQAGSRAGYPGRPGGPAGGSRHPGSGGGRKMSRRPTETETGVPLWLIPPVILKWVQAVGEELDWIHVRRSKSHYYTIRIRIRPVRREFGSRGVAAGVTK